MTDTIWTMAEASRETGMKYRTLVALVERGKLRPAYTTASGKPLLSDYNLDEIRGMLVMRLARKRTFKDLPRRILPEDGIDIEVTVKPRKP